MSRSKFLDSSRFPPLRRPVILAAFAGWNDASQVATSALSALILSWSAERIAEIDSESFFVFSESRPIISLTPAGGRDLQWPSNEFFIHRLSDADSDAVILLGTEPQLRWHTFCDTVVHLAHDIGASCLITLGGFLADVPHTIEPRISGFATSLDLLSRLRELEVQLSTYEGPTGIVGALHDAWRTSELPAISLWGSVPHYISAAPNPQVTLALLRRVSVILGVELPLTALERTAATFRQQIDEALTENPDALEYVRQLERRLSREAPETPEPQLIAELEEFLRNRPAEGE
jgi:proteasome assembly chaperone (PAC2) family protein